MELVTARNPADKTLSPDVVVETIARGDTRVHVVRDDLLEGGTKQRAATPYLTGEMELGYRDFVYASPFCGFAQVALAAAARRLDAECTLFCETVAGAQGPAFHEFSRLAESLGARIIAAPTLAEAEERASAYARGGARRRLVPLGFDCEEFRGHLRDQLARQWKLIRDGYGLSPRTVWLPLGSGTLSRAFRQVLPSGVEIRSVNIHVLGARDARILEVAELAGVKILSAPEKFAEPARELPPFPSNLHYDAKLWRFFGTQAADGDLLWNVAR